MYEQAQADLQLSHQLDVLRPHLRSYAEQHAVARGQQLGTKQQARIESTLAKEYVSEYIYTT